MYAALVTSLHSCIVHPCHNGAALSTPAFSTPPFLTVPLCPLPQIPSTPTYSKGNMGNVWGRIEVVLEKVASWSTKAAISLKRVKIEEKLLWRAYRNLPTLFRTVPSLTLYGLLFPKIGGSQPHPKLQSLLSRGQPTDFKFGRCRKMKSPPEKSPPAKNMCAPGGICRDKVRQGADVFFAHPGKISPGGGENFKMCS